MGSRLLAQASVKYSSKAVAISQEDITSSQFDSLGPGKAVFVNLYSNG